MSVTVALVELADVAFGTADGGSPQVGTLRALLRSLLEHLHPQKAPAQVGEDERGLLESVAGGKPRSLHQQRQPWLGRAEGQPSRPSGPPGTEGLPAPSRLVTEVQQMEQLKKRMEVTEKGMMKVMDMLQEMLTIICFLKTNFQGFQEELQLLKHSFQKMPNPLMPLFNRLVWRSCSSSQCSKMSISTPLQSILDQMKLSGKELGPELSQELAHEVLCRLSWLLEQHEAVETCVSCCESQPQQHANSGTLEGMAARREKALGKMQVGGEKGPDFGRGVLGQVGQLQEQCTRLQEAAERLQEAAEQLQGHTKDMQKADKAALETKASQEELQHAMVQLSKMMQDLLQRMSLLAQDRQKALEKLLSEIDSKLNCAALAPLQAQLEQVWRLTQQCLCQGPCCGANCAADFKRESKGRGRASQVCPTSPARPLSTSSSLDTICLCKDPADFTCKNREADILGIDGVVYMGTLSSLAANRTVTVGKDFPGAAMRTKTGSSGGWWQATMGGSRTAGI